MQQKLGREPVNEAKVIHRLCVCDGVWTCVVWPGSQIRECVNIPSHVYLNTSSGT